MTTRTTREQAFNVRFTLAELGRLVEALKPADPVLAARLAQQARNAQSQEAQRVRRWRTS